MNTQYRKNLKAVAQACKDYTDNSIEKLKWELGTYDLSVETINGTTMLLPTPANTIQATMVRIDGNSEVSENLITNPNSTTQTSYDVTFTPQGNGTYKTSGTATGRASYEVQRLELTAGTYTLRDFGYSYNNNIGIYGQIVGTQTYCDLVGTTTGYRSITITETCTFRIVIDVRSNIDTSGYVFKPMLVKGSTAPTEFKQGFEGIHNLELSGLKVEGSNLFSLDNTSLTINVGSERWYTVSNDTLKSMGLINGNVYVVKGENAPSGLVYQKMPYYNRFDTNAVSFTMDDNVSFRIGNNNVSTTISFNLQIMLNKGSTALDYTPYITPTTLPIDLTSIEDSGGNKLFEDGSLKGVGSVKDEITPSKAIKKINALLIDENTTISWSSQYFSAITVQPYPNLGKTGTSCIYVGNNNVNTCSIDNTGKIYITFTNAYSNYNEMRSSINNMIIQYNLATPIEADIDFSQLVKFEAYSNGSTTLVNTNNQDTTSTIKYLKEVAK